jgi:hypothetical protein
LSNRIGEGGDLSIIIPSYVYIDPNNQFFLNEYIFDYERQDLFDISINSYNLKKNISK